MAKLTLNKKNIVITGGSKGIGAEISKLLASKGANVFIMARNQKSIDDVIKQIKATSPEAEVSGCATDVSDYSQVKKAVKEITSKMGKVDGLICNAGMAIPKYFGETTIDEFEKINAVKYMGAVYMTRELYTSFNEGAFVTFTSSVVGYLGVFGYSSYAGPNYALIGLAETLLQDFVDKNIYVNVLCPPDTDTPGYEIEEKTKPLETRKLSGNVKLMTAEAVAKKYLEKLLKKKFIITVNFDSAFLYFLKRLMPQMMVRIMASMVRKIQKKNKK